ncbi:MAG: acyl-CoA dehydrogenase family protein [Acidimicrobiales bacterium]|nr:acyl-CoA dehydrogenase family protein [Acidimicrobiales bacterium]
MTTLLEAARDLRTTLDAEGAKAEAAGTPMTDEAVRLCKEADLYGALVTKDVGGTELNAADSLDVFTELARADGSIGWVVMAGSTATAYFSSYCPDSFTDVMFADGVPLVAGQFAPNGVAVPKGDAFHISGNYSFGSGLEHAHWAGSGSFTQPEEGDADYIFAIVPKAEAEILGNWDVMGLRSTASYDYRIDSDVPADRTFSMFGFTRYRGGKQFDLGILHLTEIGHAGWALGVMRRAIDEAAVIARTKQRMTGKTGLAEDPRFQYDLAEAESLFRAGDLWIRTAFAKAEHSAENDNPDQALVGEALQATAWFTQKSTEAIQTLYRHIGTAALRDGAFQRAFRDIHAGSQHAMVSPAHTHAFAEAKLGAAPENAVDWD